MVGIHLPCAEGRPLAWADPRHRLRSLVVPSSPKHSRADHARTPVAHELTACHSCQRRQLSDPSSLANYAPGTEASTSPEWSSLDVRWSRAARAVAPSSSVRTHPGGNGGKVLALTDASSRERAHRNG